MNFVNTQWGIHGKRNVRTRDYVTEEGLSICLIGEYVIEEGSNVLNWFHNLILSFQMILNMFCC